MVGMRWKAWKTMPMRVAAETRERVLVERRKVRPVDDDDRPNSGRSRPAMIMRSVDLPEPDGPTMPTASPRPTSRETLLRICTRAAPRPRLRSTFCSAMALSDIVKNPICPFYARETAAAPGRPLGRWLLIWEFWK